MAAPGAIDLEAQRRGGYALGYWQAGPADSRLAAGDEAETGRLWSDWPQPPGGAQARPLSRPPHLSQCAWTVPRSCPSCSLLREDNGAQAVRAETDLCHHLGQAA